MILLFLVASSSIEQIMDVSSVQLGHATGQAHAATQLLLLSQDYEQLAGESHYYTMTDAETQKQIEIDLDCAKTVESWRTKLQEIDLKWSKSHVDVRNSGWGLVLTLALPCAFCALTYFAALLI